MQAAMYLGAFTCTWGSHLLLFSSVKRVGHISCKCLECFFDRYKVFFNMMIFFYHKVTTKRRSNEDITVGTALKEIFLAPREVPMIVAISSIDAVYKHDTLRNLGLDPSETLDVSVVAENTVSSNPRPNESRTIDETPWRKKRYINSRNPSSKSNDSQKNPRRSSLEQIDSPFTSSNLASP